MNEIQKQIKTTQTKNKRNKQTNKQKTTQTKSNNWQCMNAWS